MDSPGKKYPVVVGISGASGAVLARATIDRLLTDERPVIATATAAARMVWRQESEESFGEALERWADRGAFTYCPVGDLTSPIASGTFPTAGMVVTPCSMTTVAAISSGPRRQPPSSRCRRYPEGEPSPRRSPPRDTLDRDPSRKHGSPRKTRRRRSPTAPPVLPRRRYYPTHRGLHCREDIGRTRADRPNAGGHDLPRARTLRLNLHLRRPTIPPTDPHPARPSR